MQHFIYLHGWGSSPQSKKAGFFRECLARESVSLTIPDFNQGDFYHLTLTRQIRQVEALVPARGEVTLIGSSFGALTALWLAEQCPRITRLVLLAPALDFLTNAERVLGAERFRQWRTDGELMVYHYAWNRELLLNYAFIADLQARPDAALGRALPTLIAHGRQDETIAVAAVEHFSAARPWVDLRVFDSDHALTEVLPEIWRAAKFFCRL